ncbi:hypothetical protein [Lysobacter sp. GCM10012299]|uniref:hypothetical protein n=1 Tax=Lysobacter sp. GCM10012299 TaxID=3317333 RepID=UPI00361CD0F7
MPDHVTDKLWSFGFCVIVIVCGPGAMFLGALATSAMIGNPVGGSYHGTDQVVEFFMLFGSLFLGMFLAARSIALLKRCFIDVDTCRRWQAQFEQSIAAWPAPLQRLFKIIDGMASTDAKDAH